MVYARGSKSAFLALSAGGEAMHTESTHAALAISAPGQLAVERVPTKHPHAGELLVTPRYVGVCGSDLDLLRGTRSLGTRILGHEGVADLAAVGPGASHFDVGQHVTFLPNNPQDPADVLGGSTEGLNQQYLLIPPPAVTRGMVVPLTPGIPLICGPLLEPLATVLYGQRLLEPIVIPKSLVILGAGPIGLLNALCAQKRGCTQVFLVDTSQAKLDWAIKRDIVAPTQTLLNSPELVDILLERTGGLGVDAAYLCTPRSATRSVLKQALRLVREDGGINLTAGADSSEEVPELSEVDVNRIRQANVCGLGNEVVACRTQDRKKVWLTGHSGASASYLQEAMELVLKEPASYARVISHVVSYQAAPRMFAHLLAADPQSIAGAPGAKVIIDFTREDKVIEAFDPQKWFPESNRHS
jgi:threonine dehydrogenase-like Zn-dependent dehydrogenase